MALLKGHGHYVAVIWARDADGQNHVGGAAGPTADDGAVLSWRRSRRSWKATVRWVCMDMWEGYSGAVAAAPPKAWVVVDRFHVAIHHRDAVDILRQAECHRLNADAPERAIPHRRVAAFAALREWRSLNPDQQGKSSSCSSRPNPGQR